VIKTVDENEDQDENDENQEDLGGDNLGCGSAALRTSPG
jgi:hypothetical protein